MASAHLAEIFSPSMRSTMAAKGYLARYKSKTLQTYSVSLSLWFRFLLSYRIDPLEAKRPHLELFMREYLEIERRCKPSSVHHHMGVIRGYYKFAVIDEYIDKDPSIGILLPKIFVDEWRNDWLTKPELEAMISAALVSDRASEHGLIALLAVLGLRIDECLRVQIEDYADVMQGHPVLRLIGKGGKPATIPLPVSVLRMLDAAAGGRRTGPLLIREAPHEHKYLGTPHTYTSARGAINRVAARAGIDRRISPHMFRRGVITAGLDGGIPIRDMQIAARHSDPRTTSRYDRGTQNLDGHAVHAIARMLAGAA
jgi:integrase/recombinase XerD